jgi:hypothetical protein
LTFFQLNRLTAIFLLYLRLISTVVTVDLDVLANFSEAFFPHVSFYSMKHTTLNYSSHCIFLFHYIYSCIMNSRARGPGRPRQFQRGLCHGLGKVRPAAGLHPVPPPQARHGESSCPFLFLVILLYVPLSFSYNNPTLNLRRAKSSVYNTTCGWPSPGSPSSSPER